MSGLTQPGGSGASVLGALIATASVTGTFSPTLSFNTPGNLSVSYALQSGVYKLIGDLVWISLRLTCTPTHTTASGAAKIGGLPFVAAASPQASLSVVVASAVTFPAGCTDAQAYIDVATGDLRLNGSGSTVALASWDIAQFPTTVARDILVTGCYRRA